MLMQTHGLNTWLKDNHLHLGSLQYTLTIFGHQQMAIFSEVQYSTLISSVSKLCISLNGIMHLYL